MAHKFVYSVTNKTRLYKKSLPPVASPLSLSKRIVSSSTSPENYQETKRTVYMSTDYFILLRRISQ